MSQLASPIPIIRTKLHRPPVAGDIVLRRRLLERLEEGATRRLTLVCAPAGYGKSTLLSSGLASSTLPVAWLSLDEHDSDLRTFLSYFLAAVQSVAPSVGRATQMLLGAAELPPVRVLAGTLINELSEIEELFVLVLDDYHHIHEITVHEVVSEILRHRLEPLRLFLATRHDPPLPLTTLRGRGQLTEIRVADLRFSLEETAAFLRNAAPTAADDEVVRILGDRSEGWAAGLRLAALSLRDRPVDRERLLAALHADDRHAMDFLAREVVERQPSTVRDYLLTTAVVARFCGPLCDALYEAGGGAPENFDGQRFIEWAARANLFLIALDEEHEWYRFHHLFRQLLRHQLESRTSREQIATLHARASAWYAENGLLEEALDHALEAGEPGLAGRIVAEQRRDLMNREHWHRLHRLLSLLPAELVDGAPGWAMASN
jgi:LuxR family maltose regulon positive regulatory protein